MVALRTINLGAPAAERDPELHSDFVASDTFEAVESGKARILIGNRGSGKSAIFRILEEREKKKGTAVIYISPDEYSYEILNSTLKKELEGSWAKQGAYSASWKYVFYTLALKEVARTREGSKRAPVNNIRRFLRDNFKGEQYNVIDHLISYMKRLEGIKIGKVAEFGKARELRSLYQLEEIAGLLDDLKTLLRDIRVIILVDELDKGWDASEDARQFVAGLFQAAIQANQLSPNFRVLISLRKELYDNIPEIYEDAQKVRDLVRYVRWDESGLKQLIAKRIARIFGLKWSANRVDEYWSKLFQSTLSYRKTNSFNYLVDRTLYRPREIIQFCNTCLEMAGDDDQKIDYALISSAEQRYSQDRAQDIAAEYRFQYPGLLQIFEAFRGSKYNLTRDELELHCIEIILAEKQYPLASSWLAGIDEKKLIRLLWECGFLKALAVGGQKGVERSGSRYLGPHQIETLNLEDIKQFQVHPMFRIHLGLKEK